MPLKLKDINAPASTNLVNKWADGQENTVNQHTTQISGLQAQIAAINKLLKKP